MINFPLSARLESVFGSRRDQMPEGSQGRARAHCQAGFKPLLYGVLLALILTALLEETGPAARKT